MVANTFVSLLLVCFFFVFCLTNNNTLALSNADKNYKNGKNIYPINSENNKFSNEKNGIKQLKNSNLIVALDQIKRISEGTNIKNAVKTFLIKNPTLSVIMLLIISVVIGFVTHKVALNTLQREICFGSPSDDGIANAIKDNIINRIIEIVASETKESESDEARENKINELNEANQLK
ncbi:hypothetical protein, variant 4 [Plasmodium yoelii 17X]|uniref:Gametocyte-specific protein n=4 Tax=Plasmodium yoelii TaxID=5861 RepID=Q7REG4_PLAYO|nr:gametocyte-specific protein, putative [Plasmodium yoelii]EAA17081.1 hypothetical protein [Plasmodium yoelii yoelii]ETB59880.1 hypothetical protein YYC_03251 [Plasmodium yoelii 17X]ETB59881.1 hypothetical protein, variant 1 [Plasmodium yoelii 17X]ETB59882.1 hypothetical protein, variant 2 [Plasmodium yoelii 17X]ETB59883.1 hypothetical protein, variant 3 [Plasmodium yoelii 17X]|eukprot:XP_725516.1 gametocyte-specific protein, putative [Plasmodium yoelii]